MADDPRTFQFLTNEEFNRLPHKEQVDYLANALAFINARSSEVSSLFAKTVKKGDPGKTG